MGFAIRKPAREHTSAILLSGTHLEAAIPNSSLLSKVDTDAPTIRQRYAMFQEQRPHIFDNTVKLLNETFK